MLTTILTSLATFILGIILTLHLNKSQYKILAQLLDDIDHTISTSRTYDELTTMLKVLRDYYRDEISRLK